MKSNYNDIIDIILTIIEDEEISKSIAVSGSIVPYLALRKESFEYHTDFYILVKEKKIDKVRNKIKKLSKEYAFDIVSDSNKYSKKDYGFKAKYENTSIGFFPYSIIDNTLTIKTYSFDDDKKVKLKRKTVPDVLKKDLIKLIQFDDEKIIRIMSPEYVLADKESREKEVHNPTKETIELLNKISNVKALNRIRGAIRNEKVYITTKNKEENNLFLTIILIILVIILIFLAYVCFKK